MALLVGCRTLGIADAVFDLVLPLLVLYPARPPSQFEPIGSHTRQVVLDAPIQPGPFPLVLISHGIGVSALAGPIGVRSCPVPNSVTSRNPDVSAVATAAAR